MNYFFAWTLFATTSEGEREISAKYEQVIYGETLAEAVKVWELFHGGVGDFEDGYSIEITEIRLDRED